MKDQLSVCPNWGIIDKNHTTNIKHEAPLVGIIVFEPVCVPGTQIIRNGFFHVATARKAWRTGLVDEAGHLAIEEIFREIPSLLRVSGYMVEKNFPARSLCKRLGFTFEGLAEDMFLREGKPENMVLFGLTRRKFECLHSSVGYLEPTQSSQTPISKPPVLDNHSQVEEVNPIVDQPLPPISQDTTPIS